MPELFDIQLHEELILIVPALLIIGFILKQTPKVPDWTIPWAILILGTVAGIATLGTTVEGIANGVIAGGIAITTHQSAKQTIKKRKED